jgi:uncharacterized protein (TIGR03086 family)
METLALMERVLDQTGRVIQNIGPDQLGNATPCTEWSVRDVINHLAGGATMFSVCVEEGAISDEQFGQLMTGDNLGDDYKGAYDAAAKRARLAFSQEGALEKMVKLPFGEMPAGIALNIAVFDVLTHGCDLAKATGQPVDDTELLETALAVGRQMIGPELRAPGFFDPEQPVADDASPSDKLLAFAGRKV